MDVVLALMHLMTVLHVLKGQLACVLRVHCSIIVLQMRTVVMAQYAASVIHRRLGLDHQHHLRPKGAEEGASGSCWLCCQLFCRACGATQHWPLVIHAQCATVIVALDIALSDSFFVVVLFNASVTIIARTIIILCHYNWYALNQSAHGHKLMYVVSSAKVTFICVTTALANFLTTEDVLLGISMIYRCKL